MNNIEGSLIYENTELKARLSKMIFSLKKIANPIEFMKNELKEGERLNGQYAFQLSIDPNYLKQIAKDALNELKIDL